jgi:hypothetical protein
MEMTLPPDVRACLWSYDLRSINLKRDRDLVITQVLNFGMWKTVQWLRRTYSRREIASVLRHPQRGTWLPEVLNFWTQLWKIRIPKKTYQAALLNPHPH